MNQHVPDWTTEDETGCFTDLLPMTNQKNPMGPDNDLMEQLWRNGHVVMQSRSHRRAPGNLTELKQTQKPDQVQKHEHSLGNSSNLFQEADTSWFQYPLDDSFEKEFCSEFFCEFASTDTVVSDKITKDSIAEEDRLFRFGSNNDSDAFTASATNQCTSPIQENTMPLARLHCVGSTPQSSCLDNGGVQNSSHFSKSTKADFGSLSKAGAQESSMMTVGSSGCGSNQIQSQTDPSNNLQDDAAGVVIAGIKVDTGMRSISERMQSKAHEMTVSSSSGDSGYSYGRSRHQNESNQSHKRKGRDMEDSECQSEEPEYESTEGKRPVQRPISKRRSRAAEVHNLSERKRRDRINEKMKALQELIPHCNKTDKASMLDQAIEYLKSLQLQVQMMWMGSSMASMMFPGVQQYISGMGMGHTSISAIHNALQLPRVPFANRFVVSVSSANPTSLFSSPAINAVNSPNQMQNIHLPESYAQCLGWHTMQPHQMQNIHLPESYAQCLGWHTMQPHQATKFCTYGSHMVQQNQSAVASSSSHLPSAGGPNSTHTSG